MKNSQALLVFLFTFLVIKATAGPGRPPIKYGEVKPEDFVPTVYAVDSNADALYLFDVGESHYEGNNQGWLSISYTRHARIRLLNKNGFDLATVSFDVFRGKSFEDKLDDFTATTYNIENGKVVATKLDKASLFKDYSDNNVTYKFTFPNLKEGSIIEYKYTVVSPQVQFIEPWYFQMQYPRLWSEYSVAIPKPYQFVKLDQGYQQFVVDTGFETRDQFNITDPGEGASERSRVVNTMLGVIHHTWAEENVPALKEEEFTTTINNHISKIEFQLAAFKWEDEPTKTFLSNWAETGDQLMNAEYFGADLSKENSWLNDDLKKITAGASSSEDKARKVYEYVRDNFACTDDYARYLSQPIKKTFQTKKGNVADINILLTAMMQHLGMEAHPVMLSTRSHGKAYDLYPIMEKFNYVISQVIADGKTFLLDASDPDLGFNQLGEECYNGNARVIGETPSVVHLSADSLQDTKLTFVVMANAADSSGMSASFTTQLSKLESQSIRRKLKKTKQDDLIQEIKKSYPMEIEISNTEIDSLKNLDMPVTIKYDFKFENNGEDLIYFSPILAEAYKENPFKAAQRLYPVEMNACSDETYLLNMEIPNGYVVDELPKSTRVKLNEDEGMFEYLIAAGGGRIQLRCRLQLKKANFMPEDYQTLRDFFAEVVKKEAEQIVFKKQ